MGAWRFVRETVLDGALDTGGRELGYVGRAASASPAPGSLRVHLAEQEELVRSGAQTVVNSITGPTAGGGYTPMRRAFRMRARAGPLGFRKGR